MPSSPLVVIASNTLSIRSLLERTDNFEPEISDDKTLYLQRNNINVFKFKIDC